MLANAPWRSRKSSSIDIRTSGMPVVGEADVLDRADLEPAGPHLAARDQPADVVEDRLTS